MKLTPFGKVSRKLRIDYQMTLKDMAEKLGTSSAYVSSIEVGKKVLTENIIGKYIEILCKNDNDKNELLQAADDTISKVNIELENIDKNSRGLVIQFARKLDDLSNNDIEKIRRILNRNGDKYDNKR